jgi:dihydrofolate synthase/folylpolyglutamate synthase
MLTSVLTEAGLRVGRFTSPYLRFFNERIAIGDTPISDEALCRLVERVRPVADAMEDKPTEFELISALGFLYFLEEKCDVVVLEVGMGGRFDSTNVIDASILSVITGIALDHTAFLGDTVEKIAAEKAGIIKDGCPVLSAVTEKGPAAVIEAEAKERHAPYSVVDKTQVHIKKCDLTGTVLDFGGFTDIEISLLGLYQPENAALVLSAIEKLREAGMEISDEAVRRGMKKAYWPGRFEILRKEDPMILYDGAHNPQGIAAAVKSLRHYFGEQRLTVLTGVLKDKDYFAIAKDLATVGASAFTFTPYNPRALNAEDYAKVLKESGIGATPAASLKEAYEMALADAKKNQRPLVCLGSLYTYKDLMDYIN